MRTMPTSDWLTNPRNFASDSRRARLIFSFSRSAASSSAVRRRTCSSSRIVVWNLLKSEPWALVLRSARSISAWMILFRRADSAGQSVRSRAWGGACSVIGEITDGNAGERLVDMHAEVLFAIAAEPYCIVVAEYSFNAIDEPTMGHLQFAQNTVAANYQLRLADCAMYLGKRLFEIPHEIHTARTPQHQTLFNGAKESQAAVGVDLLDR